MRKLLTPGFGVFSGFFHRRACTILAVLVLSGAAAVAALSCGGGGDSTLSCTSDESCGPGKICQDGTCKSKPAIQFCTSNDECDQGSECVGGQCKVKYGACFVDADCPEGMRCNPTKNVCVHGGDADAGASDAGTQDSGAAETVVNECASDFQCSAPRPICAGGMCRSCTSLGCGEHMTCDSKSGACIPATGDGGTQDTSLPDSGPADTGAPDTGPFDSGVPDAGVPDTGGPDVGVTCQTTGCPCGSYCDQGSAACLNGCANIGDCCAGTTCMNGACVVAQCQSDADCKTAPALRCDKSTATCVECTQDFHCPGSTCDEATGTCNPKEPGDVGAECTKDSECRLGYFCITEKKTDGSDSGFSGGYCSEDCTLDGYCTSWTASCITVSSNPTEKECLLDCIDDSECRSQYICVEAGYSGVCWPRCDNPGAGCATGYVCQSGSGRCEGTQDVTEPCGGTYNYCKSGLICAGYQGEQAHCYKECDPDDFDGPFCNTGEVCDDIGTTGICEFGGTVGLNGDCTVAECQKGLICAGNDVSGYKCYAGCDYYDDDPGCTFPKMCTRLSGEARKGICK